MKLYNILGYGAMLLGMYGCSDTEPTLTEIKGPLTTIKGEPRSVELINNVLGARNNQPYTWSKLNIVLIPEGKEKPLLCTACVRGQVFLERASEIEALVEAEINDIDNDFIEITGTHSGDKFVIDTITVGEYKRKMDNGVEKK